MAKIVALSGFMGSGKSTVGREVARRLGWSFCDLDEEVERVSGRSIPELFLASGEEGFRRFELETLRRLIDNRRGRGEEGLVLALGGGTVTTTEALSLLERDTLLVLLDTSARDAWKRVSGSGRPLARSWDSFSELAESRQEIYRAAAEVVVSTEGRKVLDVAEEVLAAIMRHCAARA